MLVTPVDAENDCARFEPTDVGLLKSEDSGTADAAAKEMTEDARRHPGAFALGKADAERKILFVGHEMK